MGHRPALNVLADEATSKHCTKQFVGVAMVIPDAGNLVQVALLGHLIVKGHHGVDIADNIKHTLDSRHTVGEQLESGLSLFNFLLWNLTTILSQFPPLLMRIICWLQIPC